MSELRTNRIIPRDGLVSGASGGVVQVVHTKRTTSLTTTSQTYIDFMTASITPTTISSIFNEEGPLCL